MIKRFTFKLLSTALLLFSVFVSRVYADELPVDGLIAKLNALHSMQANFSQHIMDVDGAIMQKAEGSISVKRPRRLHWHTKKPYEHLVVTDGQELWLYDVDLEQVSKQPFAADLKRAPALLLSGEAEAITEQYTTSIVKTASSKTTTYKLLPVDDSSLFRTLLLSFDGELLKSMSLTDNFDQVTYITFSAINNNADISDDLFNFVPPEGIDVIVNEQ